MACIILLGQLRLLDIVDDAWAEDTLPDDDISIPQVPPPATPEGGGPGSALAGSGCRACARHGALAPPHGHDVPSEDEAEEADGAGAEPPPHHHHHHHRGTRAAQPGA